MPASLRQEQQRTKDKGGSSMSRRRSMEVIEKAEYVTIGELVRLTDVRYSTLKFYTEEGILPLSSRRRT